MNIKKLFLALALSIVTSFSPSKGYSAALAGIGNRGSEMMPGGYFGALLLCGAFTFGIGIVIPICFLDENGNISKDIEATLKDNHYTPDEVKTIEGDLQKLRTANGGKQVSLKLEAGDTVQNVKTELSKYAEISDLTAQVLFELNQIGATSK